MTYIYSSYAGSTEDNTVFAKQAYSYAIRQGAIPLAPRLLYPQVLNDSVPKEQEVGTRLGLSISERREELWICDDRISAGMKREATHTKVRRIPVHRIPICEIVGNQTVQELGKGMGEGLEAGQSHQKSIQLGA